MASTKLFGKDLSQYEELDIDDILEQLSPEELEMLAGEVDPDDSLIPPSERNSYKCAKGATGPLDRKKLIDHINDQAINEPDRPDLVPFVEGTVRGKKPASGVAARRQPMRTRDATTTFTMAHGVFGLASSILGFHSMMNQEQYHASLLNKGRPQGVGWGGITKATKFKPLPAEPPNDTDIEDSIKKLSDDDANCKDLNFNNIRNNTKLESLSMSNVGLSDRNIDALTSVLSQNTALRTLNLETNAISPSGIVRLMESLLKTHTVEEMRLANQSYLTSQYLTSQHLTSHTSPVNTSPVNTSPVIHSPVNTSPVKPHQSYLTSQYLTSQHLTSQHLTSQYLTSQHLTSQHLTSQYLTSQHLTSQHLTSQYLTSQHLTSHTSPHQSIPHQSTPHQSTPHQSIPHQSTPHQSTPHQSIPHQSTPHQSTPHQIPLQ
ncbi:Tropomodulin-1 [Chionoecetes opilio]|uniref:Tropomodulin-1 n=1 Tax=Chionoecetes opilio TaxID=41210 RepID=A0A8J4Y0F0_CHIOP|nr:Tropomodulin-1 [Chionoecetes opilio]